MHAHPNNCTEIIRVNGIEVAPTLKVTFLRNDLLSNCSVEGRIDLPDSRDIVNVKSKKPVNMPHAWWTAN